MDKNSLVAHSRLLFCLDFEARANENNCFCADLEHANASLFALKCTGDVVYINRKYS